MSVDKLGLTWRAANEIGAWASLDIDWNVSKLGSALFTGLLWTICDSNSFQAVEGGSMVGNTEQQ